MNNLIKTLMDIDKKAQELDNEALAAKENMEADIEREAAAIHEKYMNKANGIINKKVEIYRKKAEEEFLSENNHRDEILNKLNNEYKNNCDKWVAKICADVLNWFF